MAIDLKFGDLAVVESGFAFKSSDWAIDGNPVVKIKNIKEGHISLEDCAYVAEDVALRASRFLAREGDILVSLTGYVGQVGRVGEGDAVLVNQRVGFVRPKEETEKSFIYHLLRNLRGQVEELGTGTAQANVAPRDIMNLQVTNLQRSSRRAIGVLLDSFDSMIALNIRISRTLEEIAQAIFKSWFIDFEPVKAKMAGEKPAGMDDATAALFPDSMEDSELGPIPKGWQVGTVGQICSKLVNGSTPSRSNSDFWNSSDFPWFKTGELSDGFLLDSKELISEDALKVRSVKVLPKGSILMAIYAAPTVGRLGILTQDSAFNQACTGMLARTEYGLPYLFLQLKNRRAWFNSFAIGAAQQNISKSIVENCPVVIATNDVHKAFLAMVGPLFTEIECLTAQSAQLVTLRDALLPRLISGELQIPEEMLGE
jgi:type I restriction enzyme S subunit